MTQDIHLTPAVTSVTFTADVKCGLYEINKNNSANAAHGPSLVQQMLQEQTEATPDRSGPEPGPDCSVTNDSYNYKAL